MPNYSDYVESVGTGASQIDVAYVITESSEQVAYPVGTYDATATPPGYVVGTATGRLQGYTAYNNWEGFPGGGFRQYTKVPNAVTIDPCDSSGQTWYVSGYSDPQDRIVYLGDNLRDKLTNNYTGCCFDENGNQVSEPSLNQARTMDIVLEGLQFDIYGKFTYASMPSNYYKNGCTPVPLASILRSETFTVTFESMTPNIASTAPYLDDDVTVTLQRSDGTSVTATSSTGTVTMTATAPQTIKIKIGGQFGKKLFPEETWEYYYEKNSEYTANADHLNFEVDVPERGPDPNEFIDAYRIDKDNNSGNINDLSIEVPTGVSLLRYEGDITNREAGSSARDADGNNAFIPDLEDGTLIPNPEFDASTSTTSRAGHRDVKFRFSITSTIPSLASVATVTDWSTVILDATNIPTGTYVTSGGSTYYVELGGVPQSGSPGDPGDPNAVPPIPPTDPVADDSGPSGTGFYIDSASGMRYRYIPPQGLVTSWGAGTEYDMILYLMNDYRVGQERFVEIMDAAEARRVKG